MSIYYLRDRWLKGPIPPEGLLSLMDAGVLDEKSPVWTPPHEKWILPSEVLVASGTTAELPAGAPLRQEEDWPFRQ